ncbi:hypothetical protein [Helicobacter macacae]|uniref:Uncharacterized protein n=1 Tax=Helicobacter macacae MIT 99-5501 TaxID=1357400 RepID=V8C7P0_9HELI|nr:hypothetical protein [Helicobacter macacae]ETD23423.1 hypothetical protein HMPREF2086_01225 [Helicobacter macacae MIT 99-5501]
MGGGGGNYDKVYIQPFYNFRSDDYKRLIWEANPYVDGVLENYYITSPFGWQNPNAKPPYDDTQAFPFFSYKNLPFTRAENLLDKIMLHFGLDDGERMHEPEIYYKPKFRPEFHKVIFDPNFVSQASCEFSDILTFFKEMNVKIDAVMGKKPTGKNSATQKACFDYNIDTEFIETPTLEDFCDLIYSAKAIYCFVTGTASLCAALKKPANVLVGTKEPYICPRYLHSPLHKYYNIYPADIRANLCPKRIKRFKILGIKGQIKIKQKNFERLLSVIKAILPKRFGANLAERLDLAFGANPSQTLTPREAKTRYKNLIKEVFVLKS